MIVDIQLDPKNEETKAIFEIANIVSAINIKEVIAIVSIICGDYHMDPELEESELEEFLKQAKDKEKTNLTFYISEEGLELEFL